MDCPEYAIVAEDLGRRFKSFTVGAPEKTAVDSISFKVRKGEIYGILGPNGAGKTTTIKMLSTLLIPSSGKATVLGMDISSEKDARLLRKRINMVSGGERGLYYRLTGRQNLEFFADLYGIPKRSQKELIDKLLDLVELNDSADMKCENYSRGMKQRIHIARALINSPEILYLDEPTIGLDPEISKGIRRLIRRLSEMGTTIILTTHYMFEAEELCNDMIILRKGRIVGQGTVLDIKDSISDASLIRVVTSDDPSPATDTLTKGNVGFTTVKLLNGRYSTTITTGSNNDSLDPYENLFRPYGVKNIGAEEPTLEDAYLRLIRED
jgi:ABC-2 type transport system ATP-binding protein